jgi:hypothetical protein
MLQEPPILQVAMIGLALLCVVVLFVAARSPWGAQASSRTVGRSSGKLELVSLMGVLRSGTGRLQSGSAGLDLRKATCGPVPTRIISRTRLLTRAISPDFPAEGEPDDEC